MIQIKIEKLHKHFHGVEVLKGIDLSVQKARRPLLLGPLDQVKRRCFAV